MTLHVGSAGENITPLSIMKLSKPAGDHLLPQKIQLKILLLTCTIITNDLHSTESVVCLRGYSKTA